MPEPASHELSILRDAVVFLLAAVIVVPIFHRLKVNSVIGYLVAGMLIGPFGFALVREVEGTHQLAEFGIVFMLFAIGLELSFERLKAMARHVFGLGTAQVAITGVVLAGGALSLGAGMGQAAVIGGALALSSTAFVLQLLSDRGELSTQLGRIVLAVLLLQDLAVVPGLAVVTALGTEPDSLTWSLTLAALKALVALIVLMALGRLVLRPLYRTIAMTRNPELFFAATLLVVLGTAWAIAQAGLSMALGAFLAGLMLASTEYRHRIEADIRPARGILLALFFISIGMLIDLRLIVSQLPQILTAVAALIVAKGSILYGLSRLFGLPRPLAANAALHLAQGGEFAFVLFTLAMGTAVLSVETGQFLLAVVVASMALTPLLAWAGRSAQRWLEVVGSAGEMALEAEAEGLSGHVIIAGFGRVGKTVARMLDARNQRWIAVDMDAANVTEARAKGFPVFFGDASHEAILDAAGAERARAALITLDDPAAAAAAVSSLRASLPDLPISVRARDREDMSNLLLVGATNVTPETTEASLLLGGVLLRSLGHRDDDISDLIDTFRRHAYEPLKDTEGATSGRGAAVQQEGGTGAEGSKA